MWKEWELGYLAGMIDGEGSIYIQRRLVHGHWSYHPRFQITNTNRPVMEWIHQTFGGLIYDKPRKHINLKWKMQIEWFTTVGLMDTLLPLIYPFLIIKKPQATIMMKFRKTFTQKEGRSVSQETQNLRFEYLTQIKHLNSPLMPSPLLSYSA